jgi:hypothetical protein
VLIITTDSINEKPKDRVDCRNPPPPIKKTQEMEFNVIFATETTQTYYPLIEFSTKEKNKINELELIRRAIERDKADPSKHITTFYFFSPPGLGKTVLGGYLSKCYRCPYQVVNCVSSMIDLDLLGSQILEGDETKWQDGPIPSIIRAANHFGMGILIINELNALTVNAQMGLNPLLDKQEGVVLTQNNNEFLQIKKDAHLLIIASMNPDVLGINELQDSVRDRASAIIHMTYPSVDKEAWLVQKLTGLDTEWANKYCEVIAECRRAKFVDRSLTKAPSTRALVDWITYSKVWGPQLAFELTIANRYCAGVNIDEKQIYIRIAAGKGIQKWKLPESISEGTTVESDSFFFPIPQDEVCQIKPKQVKRINNRAPISKKEKKRIAMKKKVERLKLTPLDSFIKPAE